jgi:hypothetical protein
MKDFTLKLKKLDGEKKTIEMWVDTGIISATGENMRLNDDLPFEEINFNDIVFLRVQKDYCTPDKLQDICETVGELKRRGELKKNVVVIPEWIEICKLCLVEESKPSDQRST